MTEHAGNTIDDRCQRLADQAAQLATDVTFRESLTRSRGHLTMTHVSLHSARLSIARAKEAIDRVAAAADAFVKESA